ncbi:MAG: nucleoside-diphosphate sugar epimerase, partial [Phycisphaerae bacterium]|nr:nucleoside-diphosphate sugar epimerase [Phycisphaerae bacterium]
TSSGSSSIKKFVPYDLAYGAAFDDLRRRVPNLDRVRQAVGFSPTRDLDSILRELIDLAQARSIGDSP